MKETNPPRSPLIRGEDHTAPDDNNAAGNASYPPLIRGARGVAFLPYEKTLTPLARENRKNPTPAESKMWNEVLRKRQFADYKFLRQKPIASYIVDFYCSKLRWVIEIDGDTHAETTEYDLERTKTLNVYGLTVIRYANQEVLCNIEGVYQDLAHRIAELTGKKDERPPTPAL
ncbi:MAG: endonuclease domain-containing protein [Methylococcaceae bacterium]|nr:endonuclease domain-containing protein [Methylococcaceae bacterium]